ncbi:MAG: glycosyltransferase [Acidimicrobiia bacterium]
MTWLRRAGVIPAFQLTVDASVLTTLRTAGLPVAGADAAAVLAGGLAEYALASAVAREGRAGDDPHIAHVRYPRVAVAMVGASLVVDVAVCSAVERLARRRVAHPLVLAKVASSSSAILARFVVQRTLLAYELRGRVAARAEPAPAPGDVRLSVVIPAFHEADRVGTAVATLRAELADVDAEGGLEIVVVDDGSADGTAAAAERAGADVVLAHAYNRGKGAAVRTGVAAARGRTIAFTDADLSYAPDHVRRLMVAIEDGADVAVGSRSHAHSTTDAMRSPLRRVGSAGFNALTRPLLIGGYRDTQCGVKAFRSDVARSLFRRTRIDGFAFDVELFHLVERDGLRLVEVPVSVRQSSGSTVRVVPNAVRVVRDVGRIRRWAGMGLYDDGDGRVGRNGQAGGDDGDDRSDRDAR